MISAKEAIAYQNKNKRIRELANTTIDTINEKITKLVESSDDNRIYHEINLDCLRIDDSEKPQYARLLVESFRNRGFTVAYSIKEIVMQSYFCTPYDRDDAIINKHLILDIAWEIKE